MFVYGAVINMVLAIFNLLPVPGLDGWNILRTYWKKDLRTTPEFVKGIFIVLVMLLFAFFNYIYLAARIAVEFMIEAILVIGGWK
jgi:Zn-dependent protease